MHIKRNESLIPAARALRKDMTRHEKKLWYDFLRHYPIRFSRQKILGWYVADFYCAKAKLVLEIDGDTHFDPEGLEKDRKRDEFLEGYGLTVVHIQNHEIDEAFSSVCDFVDSVVRDRLDLPPWEAK